MPSKRPIATWTLGAHRAQMEQINGYANQWQLGDASRPKLIILKGKNQCKPCFSPWSFSRFAASLFSFMTPVARYHKLPIR